MEHSLLPCAPVPVYIRAKRTGKPFYGSCRGTTVGEDRNSDKRLPRYTHCAKPCARILLVDPTVVVGANRAACPIELVEVTLCIAVSRADLVWREAHRASEMRSGEDLRSTVFQLPVEPAWLVAAFDQGLIDGRIRIIGGGIRACGCRRSGYRGRRVRGGHCIVWWWSLWPGHASEQH
jgi:hypothetical protein